VPSWRTDQGLNLACERAVIYGSLERAAAFAFDDRRQIGSVLVGAVTHEHHVDAMATRDIAMNAFDAFDGAGCVGVAQDQRRALNGHAVD
jgi:hypothetical protein